MKNIIAVAAVITVVMAIVLIAFPFMAYATLIEPRTFTPSGGNITYEGSFEDEPEDEDIILNVYSGEKIRFFNFENESVPVTVSGPYNKEGEPGYYDDPCIYYKLAAEEEWDSEGKPTKGYFKVEDSAAEGGWFRLMMHSISVELVGEREKVRAGENFILRLKKNDRDEGVMKLTIEDDDGYSITNVNGTDIYEVLLDYEDRRDFVGFVGNETVEGISVEAGKLLFDTLKLDMEAGDYKVILEDYATEAEGDVEIEVEKIYLEVECDDEVVKGDDIVIIITSSFYEEKANITVGDDWKDKTVTLDEEGKKKVKISTEDADFRTYKVTVDVCGTTETKYVTVKKGGASIEEVPENATVGDIVHIEGTSDFGDFALFVIDDVVKGEARISDDKFEWDWDTSGEIDGYREIEVFIVSDHDFSIGDHISEEWRKENGVDASADIILQLPTFSMIALERIAKGDEVLISGTASGTDHIYLIIFNSRGEVVFPPGGTAMATPVEDGAWEEEIKELDTGSYVVISLHKGRDDETEAIKNGKWMISDETKTLDQRVAIVEDAIKKAGSDDIFVKKEFKVVNPEVKLELEDAIFGENLTVVATTNVKGGTIAWISMGEEGSEDKEIKKVKVNNGRITAEFDTNKLSVGRWKVLVDIPGRCCDEGVITIQGQASIPASAATPIATVMPSLTAPPPSISASEEETGTQIPGFEVVSSLAVLIAVAYLTRGKARRRWR